MTDRYGLRIGADVCGRPVRTGLDVEASPRESRVSDFEVQDDVNAGRHGGAAGDCHP